MIDRAPLGMMQGRLSPIKGGKIQTFPWQNWIDKKEKKQTYLQILLYRCHWTSQKFRETKSKTQRD